MDCAKPCGKWLISRFGTQNLCLVHTQRRKGEDWLMPVTGVSQEMGVPSVPRPFCLTQPHHSKGVDAGTQVSRKARPRCDLTRKSVPTSRKLLIIECTSVNPFRLIRLHREKYSRYTWYTGGITSIKYIFIYKLERFSSLVRTGSVIVYFLTR